MKKGPEMKFRMVDDSEGMPKVIVGGMVQPRSMDAECHRAFIKFQRKELALSLEGLTIEQLDELQWLAASLSEQRKTLQPRI